MSKRIKRTPADLHSQMLQAIAGVTAEGAGWPAAFPSAAALTTAADDLQTLHQDSLALEGALSTSRVAVRAQVAACVQLMQRVDEGTDALYGPSANEKSNFGLTPKGANALEDLVRLTDVVIKDGLEPGTLVLDWENIQDASYEVQWATDSAFANMVGSATSASASDYSISGLVPGTQYWVRVRPIRGGQFAEWCTPETRFAPGT